MMATSETKKPSLRKQWRLRRLLITVPSIHTSVYCKIVSPSGTVDKISKNYLRTMYSACVKGKHRDTHCCKRGIENLLAGKQGLEKFLDGGKHRHLHHTYVMKILEAQTKLQTFDENMGNMASDQDRQDKRAEAIRLFSREQTKVQRQRAYKLGFQDASDAKSIIHKCWKNSHSAPKENVLMDATKSLANSTLLTIHTSVRHLNTTASQATERILTPTASHMMHTTKSVASSTIETLSTSVRHLNTTACQATESILAMAKSPT